MKKRTKRQAAIWMLGQQRRAREPLSPHYRRRKGPLSTCLSNGKERCTPSFGGNSQRRRLQG